MKRYDSFFTDDNNNELTEFMPVVTNRVAEQLESVESDVNLVSKLHHLDTSSLSPDSSLPKLTSEETTSPPESTAAAFTELFDGAGSQTEDISLESDSRITEHAALPADIARRPQTDMKARFSGHALFNDMVRRDWQLAIAADPMAFDALLYIPTDASDAETDPESDNDDRDEPAFTEINTNQKTLSYSDAVLVAVLDCPDERPDFSAVDSDGEQDGGVDEVMVLRISPPLSVLSASEEGDHPIARAFVPVGSIIEWNEALASGHASRSWWYVHRIFTYGTASVGSLYYCIPARNYDAITEVQHESE